MRLVTGDWYANIAAPYNSDTGDASLLLRVASSRLVKSARHVRGVDRGLRVQQHGIDGLVSGFYGRKRLGWRVVHADVGPEERFRKGR